MSDAQPKRSKAVLWVMLALTVAPVAGSYLLYYFWPPERTVNYGELLESRTLPDVSLTLADGQLFRSSAWRGKWVLAMFDSGVCDEYCAKKLYFMRQVRLAQGKEMGRVERAFFITDTATLPARTLEVYEGTWLVRGVSDALISAFPATRERRAHIYLIDPLGNVVLRYPQDPDPRRMIKDLQRLLKYSRIG